MPMRTTRKTEYTDYKTNTKNNLYQSFFNYISELGLTEYLIICQDLVNATDYYGFYQKEREQSVNYCSPQEGASIISLYFTVLYLISNSSLNNLKKLQNEYKLTNKTSYQLSLGNILKELNNSLKGSILSFTSINPNTPPYVLQTTGAEQIFDGNLNSINDKIDKLLL
jgi:hypothetical protein